MRKFVKIQKKKIDKDRELAFVAVPGTIMARLKELGWQENKTELLPSVVINEKGIVRLLYSEVKK